MYLDQSQVYGGVTTPGLGGLGAGTVAINADELRKVAAGSLEGKINWYVARIKEGFTDAELRAAVEQILGRPEKSSDWDYLKRQATLQILKESQPQGTFNLATIVFAIGAYLLLGG